MRNLRSTQSNRRLGSVRLVLTMGLALLFLAALLWGLQGATPAHADPGTLYVDSASGQDIPTCGTTITPCQTISYTLNSQAAGGDVIRVAQGVYTENLTINISVTLEGGYEAVGWTRNITLYETIMDGSDSQTVAGDWDGNSIYAPAVISDSGQFKMWYTGQNLYGAWRLGQATSPEGITWTESISNPLLDGYESVVLKQGSADYKMWFSRDDNAIYRATSTDGLAWTVDPTDPVFEPTNQGGSWERDLVSDPSIVQDGGGTYWMFYEGANWDWDLVQIGVVTSTDGVNWTRVQTMPVISPGGSGDWDEYWTLDPMVVYDGGFKMWYSGRDSSGTRRIGYATSTDGLIWTKDAVNSPVFEGDPGQWDDGDVGNHAVYYDGDYGMWYSSNGEIGYVTSTDGLTWTRSLGEPVLSPGTPGQWGSSVMRFEGGSDNAVLDGFTVTGGDGQGGIVVDSAAVAIANATVTDNSNFADWGGGILVNNGATAVISHTTVISNVSGSAGGLCAMNNSDVTLVDSVIQDNWTTWGAGGGIGLWFGASLTVDASIISSNTTESSGGGIHVSDEAELELVNSLVVRNKATWGGAGVDNHVRATLMNATLADNLCASGDGCTAGLGNFGVVTVTNSVLAFNNGEDLGCYEGICTVSYSNIEDTLWSGTGNINANPWFVDPSGGDYHLQAWSPCIDSATAAGAPDHDYEGDTRPQNAGYDMGADEFVGTPIPNEGTRYVTTSGSNAGPNLCLDPGDPCQTISYALTQAVNGDEIRVAEGAYTETVHIDITVTLKGGYEATGWTRDIAAHPTIVDADGADNQVILITSGANVTVEGFTVQGANHTSDVGGGFFIVGATVVISDTVVRNNSTNHSGGGVYAENATNVSLINSTFTANSAAGGASGVAGGALGRMLIQNTVFAENTGDSVLWVESGQPFEITDGQVVSNTVSGYTVINIRGLGTISGTAVLSNTSGSVAIATGPSSSVSAHGLIVRNNVGGIASSGVLTITDSIIENNSGGTRAAVGSENWPETNRLVMDGCTIRGNSTPVAVRITTGYAEIHNTKIVDNVTTGSYGPIVVIGESGTTPTVEMMNVLLADNDTQGGGSLVHQSTGSATLMNVTVAGNSTNDQDILFTDSAMTVANTIMWGNTTSTGMLGGSGMLLVSYSDIEHGWPGTGNISADPWFVDPSGGDYHLGVGSPCVDKGTLVGAPAHDIEGTLRDSAPDMGAYEWTGFRVFLPLVLRNVGP